jgi:hypothetical protein
MVAPVAAAAAATGLRMAASAGWRAALARAAGLGLEGVGPGILRAQARNTARVAATEQAAAFAAKSPWRQAWDMARPNLGDVAFNAIPSALYGASLLTQGASPLEAGGTAVTDLGLQMGFDALAGTGGARLAAATAPEGMSPAALQGRMGKWGTFGKLASMATMLLPNPVAESFYNRKQQEALGGGNDLIQQELQRREGTTGMETLDGSNEQIQRQYLAMLASGGVEA